MIIPIAAFALLLQTPPAAGPQPPAKASVAGVVLHGVSGEPIPNIRVTVARTDVSLGAFAQAVARNRPPAERRVPADFFVSIGEEMAAAEQAGDITPEAAAQARALAAVPVADIHEVIVSSTGAIAVVPRTAPPVFTDNQGRFAFVNLDPGAYKLIFAARGYATEDYGQRGAAGGGVPVALGAGAARTDIVMRMMPVGALGGRIRDTAGQALAGVPVQLFRFVYDETGQRRAQRVTWTQTDDRGEYRMYYLSPGRYYLVAGHQPGHSNPDVSGMGDSFYFGAYSTANQIAQKYALSYYPGAVQESAASAIDVLPGADVAGIDLFLSPQHSYRVRGRVVDPRTGAPPQTVDISLATDAPDPSGILVDLSFGFPVDANYKPADGTFELVNVSPGPYTLSATLPATNPPTRPPDTDSLSPAQRSAYVEAATAAEQARPTASAIVNVVNSDVEGIVLTVGVSGTIGGRVRIDTDGASPPVPFDFLRVRLNPVTMSPMGNAWQPGPTKADGTFHVNNLWPGDYRLSVSGLPEGYYVKQALFGTTDVLNEPFRFSGPDSGTLDILISPGVGMIEGVALDSRGQPAAGSQVVLIPIRNRERAELFRPVTADSSGRFTIPAVAPGDYTLAAWEAIEPFAFFDAESIKQAEERGRRVRISESSSQTVNITSIPARIR